jgi:hypothetical protein
VGLLDFLRRAPTPAATAALAPTEAKGIPGAANYFGRLVVEPNEALRDQAGYGRAGTYEFGEWDEIARSNPFVAAGLDFVLSPIRDARLDVEEPSADAVPDEALRKAVTDFVRWNLTERLPLASFGATAAHGFLKSGFALFEPLFGTTAHPLLPGGSGFYLRSMAQRLPNSLHPNPWLEDDDGRLRCVRQMGPTAMGSRWLDVELPVEQVVLFSWQREGNNWQGRSAFRAVWYIAGRVMPELLKLIGVTLQREGAGIPIASASDPSTPLTAQQREKLVDLLSGLVFHEGASAVLPAGWQLDWVFSGGANKSHVLEVWQQLGTVVLQQVGAQQLALGTMDTGSRSVGQVHDARAMAYVRGVVGHIEDALNGVNSVSPGLVRRIVEPNWGLLAAYPRVRLTLQRPELDPKTRMEAIGLAKAAGMLTVTAADENHVREELGLEPIDEEARSAAAPQAAQPGAAVGAPQAGGVVEKAADTALNGAQVAAATDLMQRVADGQLPFDAALEALVTFFNVPRDAAMRLMQTLRTFDKAPAAPQPAPFAASAPRSAWQPWRPLRASESRLKLSEMDAYFTRQRDEFERRVRPAVVGMLAMAAPSIQDAMKDGDPSEVATLPLDTKHLESVVGRYLDEVRKSGAAFLREELAPRHLTAAAGDGDGGSAPKAKADEVLKAQRSALIRRMVARLRSEMEREAIDVIARGGDASEVVARTVAEQLDTGAFRSDAAYVTTRAFSTGREEAAEAMGGVESVERTAILDSATCDECRAKDGQTADFNSPEHDALMTPDRDCAGGDACRCLLIFRQGGDS